MNKKNYVMTAVFSMSFGLIGSFLGSYFTIQPVSAQSKEVIKKVIKAESFQLVDKKGKIRGAMDASDDVTMFYLKDKNGKSSVNIQTSDYGSKINLINDKNQTIISLNLDPKTSDANLSFYSDKEKHLANGSIQKFNKLSLNSSVSDTSQIMLADNNNKPAVILQGNKMDESGSLFLMKNGKLSWNAPN